MELIGNITNAVNPFEKYYFLGTSGVFLFSTFVQQRAGH